MSSVSRVLEILRILSKGDGAGLRLQDIADSAGCGPSTAHRALQGLVAEGFVEQLADGNRYRLGLDFFVLAARAGQAEGLRDLARPCLLRLSATLNDTIFLLVRHGYDAVCLDRVEGPFPIRSFTGDIGGRVPLGIGQGGLAILAHLPEAECEAVIAFNGCGARARLGQLQYRFDSRDGRGRRADLRRGGAGGRGLQHRDARGKTGRRAIAQGGRYFAHGSDRPGPQAQPLRSYLPLSVPKPQQERRSV
jgi:hypothetical protein